VEKTTGSQWRPVPGQGQGDLAATVDPPTLKNNANILLFALFDTRMLLQ